MVMVMVMVMVVVVAVRMCIVIIVVMRCVIMIARMQMCAHCCQAAAGGFGKIHDLLGRQEGADRGGDGILVRSTARFVFEPHDIHAGRQQVDLDHAMFDRDLGRGDAMHMGLHFAGVLRQCRGGKACRGERQKDRFHESSFRFALMEMEAGDCNAPDTAGIVTFAFFRSVAGGKANRSRDRVVCSARSKRARIVSTLSPFARAFCQIRRQELGDQGSAACAIHARKGCGRAS